MELPETVSYRNLTARITHSAKDGLYHAYWDCGGHRGKAEFEKLTFLSLENNQLTEVPKGLENPTPPS